MRDRRGSRARALRWFTAVRGQNRRDLRAGTALSSCNLEVLGLLLCGIEGVRQPPGDLLRMASTSSALSTPSRTSRSP